MKIGVISDTHKLMRPEALAALHGVDKILHAGDIGHPDVLDALREIAPLTAIKGNIDTQPWCAAIPERLQFEIAQVPILLTHNIKMTPRNEYASAKLIIYGHSHKPDIHYDNDRLFFNPGSAGPRRFKLPVCLGLLHIDDQKITPEIIHLL